MKELIKQYTKEIAEHQAEIKKRKEAIEALQALCAHKMAFEGNNHNYDFYKCTICGKEEKH